MKSLGHLILYVFVGIALLTTTRVAASSTQCISCHLELESDQGPAHDFERDVHFQKGLGCQDCHGGDPTLDDMDAVRVSKGFRGAPDRLMIPEFCARCHSDAAYMREHNPALPVDQLSKYKTSVHGIRLIQQKDAKVATCVSCHTAHMIGDAKTPHSTTYPSNVPATCGFCHSNQSYMAAYGIPTDQEAKYRESVHGRALLVKEDDGAPACNDCHGNHGAAPPGASSLSAVCGMCHAVEAQFYDLSPHRAAFQEQGLPMCETCHGNHGIEHPSDSLIGLAETQLCGTCHSSTDQDAASRQIDSMRTSLAQMSAAADSAYQLVRDAGHKGMMITDEEFLLKEIDQHRIQLRASIHAFSADSLRFAFQEGMAKSQEVKTSASALIDEYYFRRWGLGVSSFIITLLAIALFLKIRAIEKRKTI